MILWTIQPTETISVLEHSGVYTCNIDLSENYNDFNNAYEWIVGEMDKRDIFHPEELKLPLWAWHTRDWKHKKPDFRTVGLGEKGKEYVCIEFEILDSEVLLSDYNNWHYVLNNIWLDDSKNEKEWNELQTQFDSLLFEERNKITVESWQKIFDVKPEKTDWVSKGAYVQATFWELKKSMIRDVKYFTAK